MKRVVFNQKGGVGKSSITCNLAAISAAMGFRTLVIDLDVQGNSSMYLGFDIHEENDEFADLKDVNVAQLYKNLFGIGRSMLFDARDCIIETPFENLDLMPSSTELTAIEAEMSARFKLYQLRKALDDLSEHYDRIYIDTPPAFGFYSKSALIAADRVLVPFDCDVFAQRALYNVMENLQDLKVKHNKNLEIEGVVINQFYGQSKLPSVLVKELKEYNIPVLDAFISNSIKMKMSHATQTPLVFLDRTHTITQQFIRLFEIIEGIKATGLRKEESIKKVDAVAEMLEELTFEI